MGLHKVKIDNYCHDETTRMTRVDLKIECSKCQAELSFLPEYLNSLLVCPECLGVFYVKSEHVLS